MQAAALTAYDEVPYPASPYSQSHPDRLQTLARLFGLVAADPRRCRVLELGCADGANLVPMAVALPESSFVGVDLASRQIQAGQEVIRSLDLANVELKHLDIRNVEAGFGVFDYIIVHGIYSWVPGDVQEKILGICSERLAANGVAYVSYNTHPGWRLRGMLRDMMLYHSRKFDGTEKQIEQARALVDWLSESVSGENNPYGMLLKEELQHMQSWPDTYFRHDSLSEINKPVYFYEFMEQAQKRGLQYLAEADFPSMISSNYSAPVDETLNRLGRNIVEMEQYMDFLRNRMFRQTLLCSAGARLCRSLGPWTLADFQVAASARPVNSVELDSGQVETFRGPRDLTVSTSEPLVKAALVCLGELWPQTIAFPELVLKARSRLKGAGAVIQGPKAADSDGSLLGSALLTCFSKGLCELRVQAPQFVTTVSERPKSCALVRLQASRGSAVTNRRHDRVMLDSFDRHMLPLLNGDRDQTAIVAALERCVAGQSLIVNFEGRIVSDPAELQKVLAREVSSKLEDYARKALLIA